MHVFLIGHRPDDFCASSGMFPVSRALAAQTIQHAALYRRVIRKSWRAGHALQEWGVQHYGSKWNALLPFWDEWKILRKLPYAVSPYIAHFIWGEFAAPKRVAAYRRKGGRVVVSVHCSPRRWESVWLRPDGYARADMVVLTSECQRPFVERDVPPERVRTILHGVVSDYFKPPEIREPRSDWLRLFMLGNTERDHEFAAKVAAKLPADQFEWRIRTTSHEKSFYAGIPAVSLLPRLTDEQMLAEYQQADVLAMPMLDSAANNVFLESMACGTPVMTNNTGGVPEYLSSDCNFVMSNDRNVDQWVEKLLWLEQNRDVAERMRPATRAWAERFDWKIIAEDYRAMYRELLA
ncbi:MAG: glycosyltransferase family 4 protein [Lentisphaerae bacterium]|nr:glycosyltransferase family 4 protein [Lentisphaerota bacterium]